MGVEKVVRAVVLSEPDSSSLVVLMFSAESGTEFVWPPVAVEAFVLARVRGLVAVADVDVNPVVVLKLVVFLILVEAVLRLGFGEAVETATRVEALGLSRGLEATVVGDEWCFPDSVAAAMNARGAAIRLLLYSGADALLEAFALICDRVLRLGLGGSESEAESLLSPTVVLDANFPLEVRRFLFFAIISGRC